MKEYKYKKIWIAMPVMDETQSLPVVMECIKNQTFSNYSVYVCVNQPDDWWHLPEKREICLNNAKTLHYLRSLKQDNLHIMDRCTEGHGWKNGRHGVGWARKTVMDEISAYSSDNDLIVSMDADIIFGPDYFSSLISNFNNSWDSSAISVPYYHNLTGSIREDRAILRYELYMRAYALCLWNICSPYCFTALGSAIALPVWAYRKIGGLSPKKSGEDFYFLQQLSKTGNVIHWNDEMVFPAARFSDRVFFGTGPAMIKGDKGDWSSYPIYHLSSFEKIRHTYHLFPDLYYKDMETPMSEFLQNQFRGENIWQPLRNNFNTPEKFIRACHEKIDGLRILQFLKSEQKKLGIPDTECLRMLFQFLIPEQYERVCEILSSRGEINNCSVEELNLIRNIMAEKENEFRKNGRN